MAVSKRDIVVTRLVSLAVATSVICSYCGVKAQTAAVSIDLSLADEIANRVIFYGETGLKLRCRIDGLSDKPIFVIQRAGVTIYSVNGLVAQFSGDFSVSYDDFTVNLTIGTVSDRTDGPYDCLVLQASTAYRDFLAVNVSQTSPQCRQGVRGVISSGDSSVSLECFYRDDFDQFKSIWERIDTTDGTSSKISSTEITLGIKKKRTAVVESTPLPDSLPTYRCTVIHKVSTIFPRFSCEIEQHVIGSTTTQGSVIVGETTSSRPTTLVISSELRSMQQTSSTKSPTSVVASESIHTTDVTEESRTVTSSREGMMSSTSGLKPDEASSPQFTTYTPESIVTTESIDQSLETLDTTDLPSDLMTSSGAMTSLEDMVTGLMTLEDTDLDLFDMLLYFIVPFFAVIVLILLILPLICICSRRKRPEARLMRDYSAKSTTSLCREPPIATTTNSYATEGPVLAESEREEGDGENLENRENNNVIINTPPADVVDGPSEAEKPDPVAHGSVMGSIRKVYNDPSNTWIQSTHL